LDGMYNRPMPNHRYVLVFTAIILGLITACSPQATATTSATPNPLRPYHTATLDLSSAQNPSATPQLVFSTPTPLIYTVVEGDTLNGIAQKFGVSLNDLLAANQDVTGSTLSIGTVLTIPTTPISTPIAGPTPVPLPFTRVDCWPSGDGGLWCFAALTNSTGDTLENLIAQISLLDGNGEVTATRTTMAMLDILPPGKSTALATLFPAPIPAGVVPQAQLVSAVRILPSDTRYAPVTLENVLVNLDWPGMTAQVTGRVAPESGETVPEIPAGRVWVTATAYDDAGRVVGVRRWESDSVLPAGGTLPFDFQISSTGPAIERVELLSEARP
jgi:LysM repeat protein